MAGHPATAAIGETAPARGPAPTSGSSARADGSNVEVVVGAGAMETARTVAVEIGVPRTANGTGNKTAQSHDTQEEQGQNGPTGSSHPVETDGVRPSSTRASAWSIG